MALAMDEDFNDTQRRLVDAVVIRGQQAVRAGRGLRLSPEEVEALFGCGPLSEDVAVSHTPS